MPIRVTLGVQEERYAHPSVGVVPALVTDAQHMTVPSSYTASTDWAGSQSGDACTPWRMKSCAGLHPGNPTQQKIATEIKSWKLFPNSAILAAKSGNELTECSIHIASSSGQPLKHLERCQVNFLSAVRWTCHDQLPERGRHCQLESYCVGSKTRPPTPGSSAPALESCWWKCGPRAGCG